MEGILSFDYGVLSEMPSEKNNSHGSGLLQR